MRCISGEIHVVGDELNLDYTLIPGQAFRWFRESDGAWVGVVSGTIIKLWRENGRVVYEARGNCVDDEFIRRYFRLETDIKDVYAYLVARDERIAPVISRFEGLRVLGQEPEETLMTYLCTTANSVPRIVRSIECLAIRFGERIGEFEGREYYSFPTVEALSRAEVDRLCEIPGLCFRGRHLKAVVEQLIERPPGWLHSLKEATYEEARSELLNIRGIGPKIADCVLLFSLGKNEAFPVDTHLWNVVGKRYLTELAGRRLTRASYDYVVAYFQRLFGCYAGWAQEYLFYDDLYPNGVAPVIDRIAQGRNSQKSRAKRVGERDPAKRESRSKVMT